MLRRMRSNYSQAEDKVKKLMFVVTAFLTIISLSAFSVIKKDVANKVKIILIGDSTTEGGKPVLENSIEQIVAGKNSTPPVEVINLGLGGETAYSLLNSGRYDRQIKDIDNVDFIFVRYGINDWFKRQPFIENFPKDMNKVIDHLRMDFPEAQIILMTIIPFLNEEDSKIVNDQIVKIAAEEELELFDIYPAYKEGLEEYGAYAMSIRFFPLSEIPEPYHELVAPYTKFYEWKNAKYLRVYSNELDPLFGHLPNWYNDKHPNPTGYRLIARETVDYILPKLRRRGE